MNRYLRHVIKLCAALRVLCRAWFNYWFFRPLWAVYHSLIPSNRRLSATAYTGLQYNVHLIEHIPPIANCEELSRCLLQRQNGPAYQGHEEHNEQNNTAASHRGISKGRSLCHPDSTRVQMTTMSHMLGWKKRCTRGYASELSIW